MKVIFFFQNKHKSNLNCNNAGIQFIKNMIKYHFIIIIIIHIKTVCLTNNDLKYRFPLPVLWDERFKKLFFPGTVKNFPLLLLSFGFNVELKNESDDGIELDRLE